MHYLVLLILPLLLGACASPPPRVPRELARDGNVAPAAWSMRDSVSSLAGAWGNFGRLSAVQGRAEVLGLGKAVRSEAIDWFSLQQNVIIDLPGRSDRMIYVVAHYDKTDINPLRFLSSLLLNGALDDLLPFPYLSDGAADNGTGVAVALETAAAISAQDHFFSYRFLFPGAEESGLRGTRAHVARLSRDEAEKVAVAVNIDTVGVRFGRNCMSGEVADEGILHRVLAAAERTGTDMMMAPPNTGGVSDYAPFRRNGFLNDLGIGIRSNLIGGLLPQRSWFGGGFSIPVISFTACSPDAAQGEVASFPNVHTPADNLSAVDMKKLYEQFAIVMEFLRKEDRDAAEEDGDDMMELTGSGR